MTVNKSNPENVNTSSPKYLYRYFTINENNSDRIKDMFMKNELFFQTPRDFNDPFDCQMQLVFNGTKKQWRQRLFELINENESYLKRNQKRSKLKMLMKRRKNIDFSNKVLRSLADDIGVLCLSEKNNDILMWSHYTQGHKGFCLEFSYSPYEIFFGRALKVIYKPNYPLVNVFQSTSQEQLDAMIFTKAQFWKYEKEWRIVEHDNGRGTYKFPKELLTGNIFGSQMCDKNKKDIREWVRLNKLKPIFYQASIKDKEYGLNIEKLK